MRVLRRRWPVIVAERPRGLPRPGVDRHGGDVRAGGPARDGEHDVTGRRSCCGIRARRRSVGAIRSRTRPPSHVRRRGRTSPRSPRRSCTARVAWCSCFPGCEAGVDPSTGYLAITGIGRDAASAQTIANAFTQGLIVYLTRLKTTQINQERHVLQDRMAALDGERRQAGRDRGPAQAASSTLGRTDHPGLADGVPASSTRPTPARGRHRRRRRPTRALGAGEHRVARAPRRPVRAARRDPARARARAVRHADPLEPSGPRRRSGCPSSPRSPRSRSGAGRAW